jgi:hypothetical protein
VLRITSTIISNDFAIPMFLSLTRQSGKDANLWEEVIEGIFSAFVIVYELCHKFDTNVTGLFELRHLIFLALLALFEAKNGCFFPALTKTECS